MDDFSAAAIARLIPLGLKRLGITMPLRAAPQSAHMALGDKRQMLRTIAAAHGEAVLAQLGQGVLDASDEPALSALSAARSPHDLVSRWQRLERYVHSRHRVRIEETGDTRIVLRHVSVQQGPAPHRFEDLMILGLLIGLLELTGAPGLRARVHGELRWRYNHGTWAPRPWPQELGLWEIQWANVVLSAKEATPETIAETTQNDCAGLARQALSRDIAYAWSIDALALELNIAVRSLQRKLAAQQSSFSAQLAQARAAHAAQLLATTAQSPAQIGYACGYADQAHFGREFKRHTALTPLQYRAEFSANG